MNGREQGVEAGERLRTGRFALQCVEELTIWPSAVRKCFARAGSPPSRTRPRNPLINKCCRSQPQQYTAQQPKSWMWNPALVAPRAPPVGIFLKPITLLTSQDAR